jgi:surface protein
MAAPFLVPMAASATAGGALPLIPKVTHSIVTPHQPDGILVQWDRPMAMSCDIKDQINVIIDGAAPVHPTSVAFHHTDKSKMGLVMATPFLAGQTISWAYDDRGPCDLQEIAAPHTEADNQTYGVTDQLHDVPMITVWRTQADGESVTLPAVGKNNFTVAWGDGTVHDHVTAPSPSHIYAMAGDHTIEIHGTCPRWSQSNLGDKLKIIELKQWGTDPFINFGLMEAFRGCTNLRITATDIPDVSLNTRIDHMCESCANITSFDFTGWDNKVLRDINRCFSQAVSIQTLNVSNLLQLGNSTLVLSSVFREVKCTTIDVSTWHTDKVTHFDALFYECKQLISVPGLNDFNTSQATDLRFLFYNVAHITGINLSKFIIANVTTADRMFTTGGMATIDYDETLIAWAAQAPNIQHNVKAGFGISKYTCGPASNARHILTNTYGWTITDGGAKNGPCISADDFVTVWRTQTDGESITLPAPNTQIDYMINWGDGSVAEHITTPNPSHVYATAGEHTIIINGDVQRWDQHARTDRDKIIKVLQLGKCNWKTLSGAFYGCRQLQSVVIGPTDISQVHSLSAFFAGCSSLVSVDVSTLDTSQVHVFTYMFQACKLLTQVDITNFDTSTAKRLDKMFNASPLQIIKGIENLKIPLCESCVDMLKGVPLTTNVYDKILQNWAVQAVKTRVSFGADLLKYTCGPASDARNVLTDVHGWTITDSGPVSGTPCAGSSAFDDGFSDGFGS